MMSIRALGNLSNQGTSARAAAHYYQEQAQDYYIKDFGEQHSGEWFGGSADRMGINGSVNQQDLQLALAGYISGKQVQNAGDHRRQMGWDVTFSAPKSVSVVWAFTDFKTKAEIEEVHKQAVKGAFDFLESQSLTRRGKAGMHVEKVSLIGGLFTHHTSRAGDPQLHSHVVIPNFGLRTDGTIGTIKSEHFYELKMTAGALYQTQLAYGMRQLGYRVEADKKGTFRLSDISQEIEKLFSKRDQVIDRMVKERGINTYAGARMAVLATRPDKVVTTLGEREIHWQKEMQEAGVSSRIERFSGPAPLEERTKLDIFTISEKKLIDRESVFKEKDMVREIACSGLGQLTAKKSIAVFKEYEEKGLLRHIGYDKSRCEIYTTKNMMELEKKMIQKVEKLAKKTNFEVDPIAIFNKHSFLSDEQKFAVEAATGKSGIAIIQGRAGTGKTTMLSAVREAYEKGGWRVEGITVSGQAAQNLQKESGIESRTIASWKITGQSDKHTIVVVDEAGMVGSRQICEILEKIENSGAKVILVGDERQLQPIEAGGALRAMDQKLINIAPEFSSQIETIRRQKETWMRETVKEAAQGNTHQALKNLNDHEKINIYYNASNARNDLVNDFIGKESQNPQEAMILTNRKSDAHHINEAIKRSLQDKGMIGTDSFEVDNGQYHIGLSVGDRIMLTKNDYKLDVRNGQRGIITKIDKETEAITIKLDNDQEKTIPTVKYNHIEYGWASTVHKAQGATVERAYVFSYSNESMASQQITYVQISRARQGTKLYVASGEKAIERPELQQNRLQDGILQGEERQKAFQEMCKSWGKDKTKQTTLDFIRQDHQKEEECNLAI